MKKLYVSINEINNSEFWRYNTYKYYQRVDDYFELANYESLWGLLYYLGNDLTDYNEAIDTYIENKFGEISYDDAIEKLTEHDYKKIVESFDIEYLVFDAKEELEILNTAIYLSDDEETAKSYLDGKENANKIVLHYILQRGSTFKWYEQLAADIPDEVEEALYL